MHFYVTNAISVTQKTTSSCGTNPQTLSSPIDWWTHWGMEPLSPRILGDFYPPDLLWMESKKILKLNYGYFSVYISVL